jgi:hypothetical protein
MAESDASWADELASMMTKESHDGNMDFPATWIRFHEGTLPGIHPTRWPSWISGDLIPILSRDERGISALFSGKEGTPGWNPSWYRGRGHPVIMMIHEDPAVLPHLHALVSAAASRRSLPLVISSAEKKALLDFLGQEILSKAMYVLPRTNLPSLDPWMVDSPDSWPGVEGMSRKGASVLLAAIAEAPRSFRNQVLLTLHGSAGDLDAFDTPDPSFRKVAAEFVLRCGELLRPKEQPVGRN